MSESSSYLTKSAFKLGVTCPTKLHYLLSAYPSSKDDNEYLELLAEGGFIVGALAQLLFPDGRPVDKKESPIADFLETKRLIDSGDVTLFEATLLSGRSLAVTDILQRSGKTLKLIEVKSKSIDTTEQSENGLFRNRKGEITSEWREYFLDVTFQYALLKRCFPEFRTEPHLILVDKGKRSVLEGLPGHFSLSKEGHEVSIHGDLSEVKKGAGLLSTFNISEEVQSMLPSVEKLMIELEETIARGVKAKPVLSVKCRDCEFKGEDLDPSGFKECWNKTGLPDPSVFDLFYGTTIRDGSGLLLDTLISEGKVSLFDVPLEALKGKRGERQHVQIEYTKKKSEWIDSKLHDFVKTAKYPLHFIDFETTRTALPFHAGMRPFEQIAFQWSCHTVAAPGGEPVHTEWINTEPVFPNFEFARSLMRTLSKEGTVLTWASHEGSVLTDILNQMQRYEEKDPELYDFLSLMVSSKGSQGRLVDMNRLTIDYYFHPDMKGKTSIKAVFPAIWRSNPDIRNKPWFKDYEFINDDQIENPYKKLPGIEIAGVELSVQEGTGAMRAYEEMIFGSSAGDAAQKESWKKLLLQYCKLDTLAMVVIWEKWLKG